MSRRPFNYVLYTLIWTTIFEVVTCVLRFGAELESTRDTASTIGQLTLGLRVHHSYFGMMLLPMAAVAEARFPRLCQWAIVIGLGLFFSDLFHHFVVLWYFTGSPQFDLVY
jgi:hypothetical protein